MAGKREELTAASADRAMVLALALLAVSTSSAVLLALDVTPGRGPAVVGSSALALVALVSWYAVPLRTRGQAD